MGLFTSSVQPVTHNFPPLPEGFRWKARLVYLSVFPSAEVLIQKKGRWFWRTVDKMECFLQPQSMIAMARYLHTDNGFEVPEETKDKNA